MKIELKKIEFTHMGQKTPSSYRLVLQDVLGITRSGMDINEMRHRISILNKLDEDIEELEVSEPELAVIKKAVKEMHWAFPDKEIVNFADYIESIA